MDTTTLRHQGCTTLSHVLSQPNNVKRLEEYIYKYSNERDEYWNLVYECVYRLITSQQKKECLVSIIHDLRTRNMGWEDPEFSIIRTKQEEEDNFIMKPFEVDEGVLECNRCGSKRTISYQRQTRSADEGSTTFAQCVECKHRWKHNN